jgi:hypothetical protein
MPTTNHQRPKMVNKGALDEMPVACCRKLLTKMQVAPMAKGTILTRRRTGSPNVAPYKNQMHAMAEMARANILNSVKAVSRGSTRLRVSLKGVWAELGSGARP